MGKQRTEFDYYYAASNTEIVLAPERCLETFGNTIINYHLVSELEDNPDKVRIREGRLEAARPTLIIPGDYANFDLDGFGKEAREYLEFLKNNEDSIRILQYGYRLKQEAFSEQVVTDSLKNVLDKVVNEVKVKEHSFDAVIKGVDELWDVCLVKLFWMEVNKSASVNIRELEAARARERMAVIGGGLRDDVEKAFARAESNPKLINELGTFLREKGIFEDYQDRFFKLVRFGS